jgi:hypothetical protein
LGEKTFELIEFLHDVLRVKELPWASFPHKEGGDCIARWRPIESSHARRIREKIAFSSRRQPDGPQNAGTEVVLRLSARIAFAWRSL